MYLGSSIHIRYSELSVHQQRKIDKMMESLMDGEESSAAIEGADGKGRAQGYHSFSNGECFFFYFSYTSLDIPHFLGYFIAYKYQNNFIFIFKSREPLKLPKSGDIWILE